MLNDKDLALAVLSPLFGIAFLIGMYLLIRNHLISY